MKNTIVIYYSLEGNSEFAAKTLAEGCGAALERLRVEKEPPKSGLKKFLVGGSAALRGDDPVLAPLEADVNAFDDIILAFPVWAGTYPPAIGAFLAAHPLEGKRVYIVACSASGKADKAFRNARESLPGCEVAGTLSLINPLTRREEAEKKLRAALETWL